MYASPIGIEAAGIFLCGIPDRGFDPIAAISRGTFITTLFQGTANIINYLPKDIKAWPRIYLPIKPENTMEIAKRPLINHMADPDFYNLPLKQAIEIVSLSNQPCLNHPMSVINNSRERMPDILDKIIGLRIPRCKKISPQRIDDFSKAVNSYDLSYPIIVRLAGTHGGKTQTLVKSTLDWSDFYSIPWISRQVYLTEYHDYKDHDGLYRKQRIAVIGDKILPRHGCANYTWSVSGFDSPPETIAEEIAWSEDFYDKVYPIIKDRVEAISNCIKLDYFGIDYSLRENGEMLIFEVSPSMTLANPYQEKSHEKIEHFTQEIRNNISQLIQNPYQWKHNHMQFS